MRASAANTGTGHTASAWTPGRSPARTGQRRPTESRPHSREAHGLAMRRPGDFAVPHHAPAAHDGSNGPALHRYAVIGRPAAARLDPGVGDGLAAPQIDDGQVRIVAHRDAALAADAEQAVGT